MALVFIYRIGILPPIGTVFVSKDATIRSLVPTTIISVSRKPCICLSLLQPVDIVMPVALWPFCLLNVTD